MSINAEMGGVGWRISGLRSERVSIPGLNFLHHACSAQIYLHPLPALGRSPLVAQLCQGSGDPLVHGRSGGLAGEHGTGHLQLLQPRLVEPLVTPDSNESVRLGRGPRHPPASGETVRGRRDHGPARRPRAHVQRREAVRRGGVGMVLVTVTEIVRLRPRNLGLWRLQQCRDLRRTLRRAGRRHVASVAKGRNVNVTRQQRWENTVWIMTEVALKLVISTTN